MGVNDKRPGLRRSRQAGFTLVEIVITMVVVSILAAIASVIILQGVRSYVSEDSRSDVHYQARIAVERMARETRMVRSCGEITGPANPSNTLQFTDINGNAVLFSVAGTTLSRNGMLLASGVASAQPFRFLDNAGNPTTACPGIWFVEVNLTDVQGAETLSMRTRVHPRNF